ncbi:MAG: septum formation initiator family protein [Dehalococcoidia bacterium]
MSKHLPHLSAARLILAATTLVVVYFLVAAAFNLIRSQQLDQQQAALETDIQSLQERYERLQGLQSYLDSDQYIEAMARQQLGLVQEGEPGFVIISTLPTPSPIPGEEDQPQLWWDVLTR